MVPLWASKRSLDAVQSIREDLRKNPTMIEARPHESQAVGFDRYTQKIDPLPMLGVDDELLTYGQGRQPGSESSGM